MRKGSDDESYFYRFPETNGTPVALLICQMLQIAQRQEWPTEVGNGKGTILRGWIAKSQGGRVKEKGNRKKVLSQIKCWPPEIGLGLV